MKKLIFILFFIPLVASSTNYYVKNGGNNTLSGTSDANAWETIAKINASSFSGGDTIFFKCGDKFIGTLTVPSNGSAGNPIVFDAYGTGDDPILTPNDEIAGITWSAYGAEGIYSTTDIPYNPGNLLINWGNKINKIDDRWFVTPQSLINNWTSLDFMRLPSDTSWTVNYISNIKFWDALDALYCYDTGTGTTYIRFRNGEDPNDSILVFSRQGVDYAAITITSRYYITIRNLHLIGGHAGIRIYNSTMQSNNILIDSCYIESSNEKIRIGSSDAITVSNCTLTNNYLSSYSPGAWEYGTTYEDGVQFNYYAFFKNIVDGSSDSERADAAIGMTGGMSDSCSFHNNTITKCANGIALFGHNMRCYSNSITGTSSSAIYTMPVGPTYIYDNYIVDANLGVRFGSVDATTYDTREHYVYRNRIYIPDAGEMIYIHYQNTGVSVTEAYIYHNSCICKRGVQLSSYADNYIPRETGFMFVNNIISASQNAVLGWSGMVNHANLFIWDYNWSSGLYHGQSSAVWIPVPNNIVYTSGPTFWDHSIDPPDFTNTLESEGEVIDAGIDVSAEFTLLGVVYDALPGIDPGDYQGDPDIGWYEYGLPDAVVLTTLRPKWTSSTTALGGGNVVSDGGTDVTERGVCWNTTGTPTTADGKIAHASGGVGSYTVTLTPLVRGTVYYVRAYAINSEGTSYGDEYRFQKLILHKGNKPLFSSTGKILYID